MSWSIEQAFPVFAVKNLAESIAYYRDCLGFNLTWTWGEPAHRAGVVLQGFEIQLDASGSPPPGGPSVVYCHMHGVDEYYAHCRGSGAKILFELEERPWGMRDFRVVDPSGNRLGFAGLREDAA